MNRTFFLFLLTLIFSSSLFAQFEIDEDITIIKDDRIDQYFEIYDQTQNDFIKPTYVYRVTLISTYQRDEAYGVQGSFRSKFPGYQTYLQHNGVKYILTAGEFPTKAKANAFVQEIRPFFPSSFVAPSPILVANDTE